MCHYGCNMIYQELLEPCNFTFSIVVVYTHTHTQVHIFKCFYCKRNSKWVSINLG
jgi:hypothetical protein